MTEHRNIEEIKKDLNADAGSNVILNWKDAIYIGCYIDALEKQVANLSQQLTETEDLLRQIDEQFNKEADNEIQDKT